VKLADSGDACRGSTKQTEISVVLTLIETAGENNSSIHEPRQFLDPMTIGKNYKTGLT
jgi:hypothetical protein